MAVGGASSAWKHGKYGAASTNTDLSAKTVSVTLNAEAETVESTTFGDSYRNYEQSFKNSTIEAVYKYDSTIYGELADTYSNGTTVTFELSPDGTGSTKPKITGSMFITSFGSPVEIGNLLQINVSWQVDGALTFSTHA